MFVKQISVNECTVDTRNFLNKMKRNIVSDNFFCHRMGACLKMVYVRSVCVCMCV